ncbi:MAG: hypothetical protein IJ595_09605 [Oscillospiraceae bacterium]|nr:hypothetical protein [Oscillospiraceae bacterium]
MSMPDEMRREYRKRLAAYVGKYRFLGIRDEELAGETAGMQKLYFPSRLTKDLSGAAYQPYLTDGDLAKLEALIDEWYADFCRDPEGCMRALHAKDPLPAAPAVPRYVVMAPPGYGKSILTKRICLACCEEDAAFLRSQGLFPEPMLPILVECKDLTTLPPLPEQENDVKELSRRFASAVTNRLEMQEDALRELFDDALEKEKVLLIVDGFDECADDRIRLEIARMLRTFLEEHAHAALLLTGRSAVLNPDDGAFWSGQKSEDTDYGALHDLSGIPGLRPLAVAPMEPEDVWLFAIHRRMMTTPQGEKERVLRETKQILHQLYTPPYDRSAGVLTQSPLTLGLLLSICKRSHRLPKKRSDIFDQLIDQSLSFNVRDAQILFHKRDARLLLDYLACCTLQMHRSNILQRKNVLSREEAIEILRECLLQYPEWFARGSGRKADRLDVFLEQMELHAGLLRSGGDGSISFSHLQIQEYLTAEALVAGFYPESGLRQPWKLMRRLAQDSVWTEVVCFAVTIENDREILNGFAADLLKDFGYIAGRVSAYRTDVLENILLDLAAYANITQEMCGRIWKAVFRGAFLPESLSYLYTLCRPDSTDEPGLFERCMMQEYENTPEGEKSPYLGAAAASVVMGCIRRNEDYFDFAEACIADPSVRRQLLGLEIFGLMSREHMQRDGFSFFRSRFRRLRGTAVHALYDLLLQVMDRADSRLDTARDAVIFLGWDNRLDVEAFFDEAMIRAAFTEYTRKCMEKGIFWFFRKTFLDVCPLTAQTIRLCTEMADDAMQNDHRRKLNREERFNPLVLLRRCVLIGVVSPAMAEVMYASRFYRPNAGREAKRLEYELRRMQDNYPVNYASLYQYRCRSDQERAEKFRHSKWNECRSRRSLYLDTILNGLERRGLLDPPDDGQTLAQRLDRGVREGYLTAVLHRAMLEPEDAQEAFALAHAPVFEEWQIRDALDWFSGNDAEYAKVLHWMRDVLYPDAPRELFQGTKL